MRRLLLVALLALAVLAGCGGDDTPTKPDEVAGAWVEAMNDRDWDAACRLSAPVPDDAGTTCAELLEEAFADVEIDMELEGVYLSDDAGSILVRRPVDGLAEHELERHDGEWRVHFEIQIIR